MGSLRGHEVLSIFTDAGVSGAKDAADRPGLTAALELLEDGPTKGLVVTRLDRLARNLTVQKAALAHVWKQGAKVFSCDVGEAVEDDPSEPKRNFVRQVMGAAAQLERDMIAASMRAGRERKAAKGGYAGGTPYGYRAVGRELVPDETERGRSAAYEGLHCLGTSSRTIATELESEGLNPPERGSRLAGGHTGRHRRSGGGRKALAAAIAIAGARSLSADRGGFLARTAILPGSRRRISW